MNTLNLNTLNTKLVNMTQNIKTANEKRTENIKLVINEVIAFGTTNKDVFTTKKNAISIFIKTNLGDTNIDNFTKRALKVAQLNLIGGYKAKFDLLSISQTEQLFKFNKNEVSKLMTFEGDVYIDAVKALIKTAKIEKTTKVFSAKLAQTVTTK